MRVSHAIALSVGLLACGGTDPFAAIRQGRSDAGSDAGTEDSAVAADGGADAGLADGGDAGTPPSAPPPPPGPSLAGCPMFPADHEWNRDVSADPVDPHSVDYLAFMGAGSLMVQPVFGGEYGQPYLVVPATQPRVPMAFKYWSQSEPGPYPFPLDVPIQNDVDLHATVMVQGECKLYETYFTKRSGEGFTADSGAVFDLISGAPRPDGWTSATAAGLPILPSLVRYDEVAELGEIRHAFAFTAGSTAPLYVAPATHSAGTSDATWAPPMGLRVRLRADYDTTRFHGASLVIVRALQKYGMFVTDTAGGQFWGLAGTYDPRWSVPDLDQLKTIPARSFEVVKLGTIHQGL